MNINKKEKNKLIGCVVLLLLFTTLLFGPIESYYSNAKEFWFPVVTILPYQVVAFILLAFVLTFFLKKLPNIFFSKAICIIFGLGVAFYLQGNYLNINYGVMNGQVVEWNKYILPGIANSCIWIACIIIPFIIYRYKKAILSQVIMVTSLFIIAIQIITLITLTFTTSPLSGNSDISLSDEKINEVSKDKNIIVFILDTFDLSAFEEMINKYPEYKNTFKDFTFFDNASSGSAPTVYGIPLILTGKYFYSNINYTDYLKESYEEVNFFKELKTENYDTRLYTEPIYLDKVLKNDIDNIVDSRSDVGIKAGIGLTKEMYKLTAIKYVPHFLKKYFWFYSGDFDAYKQDGSSYIIDDVQFYNNLLKNQLETTDKYNVFKFYHLYGAHGPFTMNEKCERIKTGDLTQVQQEIGTLEIVKEYINQLKKMGVYDKSNIIIMADHGGRELYQSPLFMVKSMSAKNETMKVSKAPISFEEFVPTVLSWLNKDYSMYGKSVFDFKEDEQRKRKHITIKTLAEPYMNKSYTTDRVEFAIDGNSRNRNAIHEVGEVALLYKERSGYNLGKKISFLNNGTGIKYTAAGFGLQDDIGIWTTNNDAEIKLKLNQKVSTNLLLDMEFDVYNDEQYMEVLINGKSLGEKKITTRTASFVIPKEYVLGDILTIGFKLRNAVAPKDIRSDSEDYRKLAFLFKNITIKKTTDKAEQLPTLIADLNETKTIIDFSASGNNDTFIQEGWHNQEQEARWTSKEASIVANAKIDKDIKMEITYRSFSINCDTSVLVNDVNIGVLPYKENMSAQVLIIPKVLMKENGTQKITFLTEKATSPLVTGKSNDYRKLGIEVNNIILSK